MGLLKVGEKDRQGRQKRIEHTGPYLRASRTGGVALRAQGRVGPINVTGNTSHGLRVSTRLAKNTQVAFQNGRFILRGRYGSDAAKLNVSKSGLSVSSKTPIGTFNWLRPGSSSAKIAGIQVRGKNAQIFHAIYLVVWAATLVLLLPLGLVQFVAWLGGQVFERYQRPMAARERLELSAADVAPVGERLLAEHGVELKNESRRDLFAALVFCMVALDRGRTAFDRAAAGMPAPDTAAEYALATDVRVVGEEVARWLARGAKTAVSAGPEGAEGGDGTRGGEHEGIGTLPPEEPLGVVYMLASEFARRVDEAGRGETLLSLDDACLAAGPWTRLQEAMLDVVAEGLGVGMMQEEGE